MVIGLTGGSGSGKTSALRVLQALGARCFDADAVYHDLLRTDAKMLAAIEARFPGTVENGALQRKKLGAQVFGDPEALRTLSALTHPYVVRAIEAQLDCPLAVIDAIGLFESGLDRLCSVTVAVTAPREVRIARLIAREGVSAEYAAARIDAQRSDAEFSRLCDVTLENNGTQAEFEAKCRTYFEKLLSDKGEYHGR